MGEYLVAIIISAFGSSGLWAFAQWLLSRKSGIASQLEQIQGELKNLKQQINDNEAKASRIRIINFADRMKVATLGKEAWLSIMRDIDAYELYCDENPSFKNTYAKLSIELIKDTYEKEAKL